MLKPGQTEALKIDKLDDVDSWLRSLQGKFDLRAATVFSRRPDSKTGVVINDHWI
jgi:hypothetical protein